MRQFSISLEREVIKIAKYGMLNTQNFQSLLDDCKNNETSRNEVIAVSETDTYKFFTTYFILPDAANEHLSKIGHAEGWGKAFSTDLKLGRPLMADIDDPSKWEFGADRIRMKLDYDHVHNEQCTSHWALTLRIWWA